MLSSKLSKSGILNAPVAVAEVPHLREDLALPVDAVAHLPPSSLADFPVQVEQVQPLPIENCIWEVVIVDLCMLALLHHNNNMLRPVRRYDQPIWQQATVQK